MGVLIEEAIRLDGKMRNNETKYETLITGLSKAKDLDVKRTIVFCDSQLVVNRLLQLLKLENLEW